MTLEMLPTHDNHTSGSPFQDFHSLQLCPTTWRTFITFSKYIHHHQ